MAYMDKQRKAQLAPAIQAVLKKYKMRGTISVRHHSTLVIKIKSGKLDVIGNYKETLLGKYPDESWRYDADYLDVNAYHYHTQYTGEVYNFINELFTAANTGNWDKSDIQSDYFNVGWYVDVHIGLWNKPYVVEK